MLLQSDRCFNHFDVLFLRSLRFPSKCEQLIGATTPRIQPNTGNANRYCFSAFIYFFSWGYHVFILEDTAEMALNTGTSDFLSSFRRLLSNQDQANSCQKFHAYRFAIDT